jgi:hypothetical protein
MSAAGPYAYSGSANLADVLERVLDKGLVIAGDIRINLLDIELLTVKLRLVIASLETAREVGMDWWAHDPWFAGGDRELEQENRRLRRRVEALEAEAEGSRGGRGDGNGGAKAVEGGEHRRELDPDEREPEREPDD